MELIALFGEYQEIDIDDDPAMFKASIPDASYRCQLLHGMAAGILKHAFYVVASLRKILRVVHVRIGSLMQEQYISAITNLVELHLNWMRDGIVPAMTFEAVSHAVDQHSVQFTFDLWKALCRLITEREGRPLPAGRHLIPEVVATWNRGKGPIDVYSQFQKNCKSSHSHLGPVGAIWLRLIMTCVYNAYHSFTLSRTVEYLMSDECESFKDFQKRRARQVPFRQFCQMLASDLTVEVVPPSGYESSSSEEDNEWVAGSPDENDERTDREEDRNHSRQRESVAISYNKREAFFAKPHLIAKRMNRRLTHLPSSARRQSSCVWCCRRDHSTPSQSHCRHGRKTTWVCSICDVPQCKVPRFNGQSCFVLFHQSETLFDPCLAEAQGVQVTVRSHGNRRALPGRKAEPMVAGSSNSDDDDDESSYEPPVTRQRMCSTITVPVRSTRRTCL